MSPDVGWWRECKGETLSNAVAYIISIKDSCYKRAHGGVRWNERPVRKAKETPVCVYGWLKTPLEEEVLGGRGHTLPVAPVIGSECWKPWSRTGTWSTSSRRSTRCSWPSESERWRRARWRPAAPCWTCIGCFSACERRINNSMKHRTLLLTINLQTQRVFNQASSSLWTGCSVFIGHAAIIYSPSCKTLIWPQKTLYYRNKNYL